MTDKVRPFFPFAGIASSGRGETGVRRKSRTLNTH